MTFDEILAQVRELLQREQRLSYRALKRRFALDNEYLEDLKAELVEAKRLAVDEDGKVLVWTGGTVSAPDAISPATPAQAPLAYTPSHLTEKILAARRTLEGERKQVSVFFADIKDSTRFIEGLDPEAAQRLLDPAIHIMMHAVHRYEGTVNQVLGDGIMALFGAPIAHEDHALRACYAALALQSAIRPYAEEVRRTHGMLLQLRVGLNSGEVVVRAIGNDLHMEYSAVGQNTHLAARMEQLAAPGSILLTAATLRLVEGLVRVNALGPMPVKGLTEPVEVYELVGATALRRRFQATASRGLTRFVGRQHELDTLQQTLSQAGAGHEKVVAMVGDAGVGKSRLVYEFLRSHHTQGWLVLESASVSYGKATPYLPVVDLLKRYAHLDDRDEPRTIRARMTGHLLTLDDTLQEAIPALLALLDALPADSPFLTLDPPQRRQRTLAALKCVLLRESQVQPLLLVFEDLHWIDTETQALLDSLLDSLPTARLLLLVNYRPEYQHGWGHKTYYTQLRLDSLPPASVTDLLQALVGDDVSLEPLKRLLIERTAGNPFFLEESVRTLVEIGVLVGEPGAYRLATALPTIQVPATVQAVLAARIDRLPPEEKRLLQTAAVIGMEVPFALLQAIAAAQRALALATASEEVVLHALANQRLGVTYQSQGDYRRAIDCLRQTVASLHGAQRRDRLGQANVPSVQSLAYLAACHGELGMFAEGRVLGEEGLQIAETVVHPSSLMWASYGIGLLALCQGDLPKALPLLERAMGICQEADLPLFVPRMATALGAAYSLSGRVADAVALLTQAMEQTRATDMAGFQALYSLPLGEAQLLAGRLEEAHALAEQALALTRAHQELGNQAYALRLLGEIAARHEPPESDQAGEYFRQALTLAEDLGMRPLVAHCHLGLGTLYGHMGQVEQARAELTAAIELYRTMDMTFWLPQAEMALAQVEER